MKRDPAGRLGPRGVRTALLWALRWTLALFIPALILVAALWGLRAMGVFIGAGAGAFIALAMVSAWLDGAFNSVDR